MPAVGVAAASLARAWQLLFPRGIHNISFLSHRTFLKIIPGLTAQLLVKPLASRSWSWLAAHFAGHPRLLSPASEAGMGDATRGWRGGFDGYDRHGEDRGPHVHVQFKT